MRITTAVVACALAAPLAACGTDPTLAITVVHPPGSVIASTTITVYVSASLTCEDVQFGDVSDSTLAGLQVAQETLRSGSAPEGSLADLPRVDHKVIVARGIGADGKLASAGCTEEDVITGSEAVEIDTQAAVLASIAAGTDAYGIALTVAGLDGMAVAGRPVSWRVIGPDGTHPVDPTRATLVTGADATWDRPSTTCTASDGTAVLHPMPPDLSGGYAARIRVAWAQDPPPPFTALTPLVPGARPFTPVTASSHPCAVGHNAASAAKQVVACLESASSGAAANATVDVFTVGSTNGTVQYASASSASLAVGAGIFARPSGTGSDVDIIAYDSGGLGKLVTVYGTATVGGCSGCGNFTDVMYVPACGALPELLLGHGPLADGVSQVSPLGGTAQPFASPNEGTALVSFVSAGCVTRFDTVNNTSDLAQVVVLDYTKVGHLATIAVACTSAGCKSVPLPVAGAGVAFTTGSAPAAVIPEVDASGVVLSTVDIVTSAESSQFLDLSQIASVAVPHRIAAGQLDSDGQLDFAWDDDAKSSPLLQVAYARAGFSGNLSAFTLVPEAGSGSDAEEVVDVVAGPALGHATDDVVIATTLGAIVLPSLVTPATGTVPQDIVPATCPAD